MAFDLKLNVFTISLRKRNDPQISFTWSELINLCDGNSYSDKFKAFFVKYVNHFEGKFTVYKTWNKGLNVPENGLRFASKSNKISGIIEGGYTDIGSTIKNKEDVNDTGFSVTRDHINVLPFYFNLWLPEKSDKGLLIVQSISDRTIYEPLKFNLKKFIESFNENFFVDFNEHTTKKAIEKMQNHGAISQFILRKSVVSSDKVERVFNKKYFSNGNINIEIKITGLSKNPGLVEAIKDFMYGKRDDLLEVQNLKKIGFDEGYDIFTKLEHNGHTAIAKIENNISLSPVYYIDSTDVPLDQNNHPVLDKLVPYMDSFLEAMKDELKL